MNEKIKPVKLTDDQIDRARKLAALISIQMTPGATAGEFRRASLPNGKTLEFRLLEAITIIAETIDRAYASSMPEIREGDLP